MTHQRLLKKLTYYDICYRTHEFIKSLLTTTKLRVVVDGEASATVHVDSRVLHGTALSPLMVLLLINDIGDDMYSSMKLFADDCLLFRRMLSA